MEKQVVRLKDGGVGDDQSAVTQEIKTVTTCIIS